MSTEWTRELHPDWYKDVSPMQFLILGSFPPHPSKQQYPFYYPTGRNRFWKILAELAGETLQWTRTDREKAAAERYEIMKKLNIGVQNMGLEIERKGMSALDTDIRIIRHQNILGIVEAHPELKRILLTGYSAPNSAARSFINYLRENGIDDCSDVRLLPEHRFNIRISGRTIDCVILNSTSTASRIKYDFLLEQFRKYLS